MRCAAPGQFDEIPALFDPGDGAAGNPDRHAQRRRTRPAAQFDHMAQVTVVSGDGAIYQHVYGGVFGPQAIVEPLKDLVFGRQRPLLSAAGLLDRVRFYCTIFNPNTGRYYFNYSLIIAIVIGVFCFLVVGGVLIREFRRSARPTSTGNAPR